MNNKTRAYLEIHIAVFLFGFTGILGKVIQLSEAGIVWYRLLITCVSLMFIPQVWRSFRRLDRKKLLQLTGVGVLVCIHWVLFYGSIKYSNVSVSLSCLATASFWTALIEPLLLRRRFKYYELILSFLIVPGMYLIFFFGKFYLTGIIMGLLAAILAAVFATLNKRMITKTGALTLTFIELGGGWVFLSLMLPFYFDWFPGAGFIPDWADWGYLLILGLLCTTLAYVLSVRALRSLSAFAANLTINLEPVYGILMAVMFFRENEELDSGFFLGAAMILLAVFLHPFVDRWFGYKEKK